MGAGTEIVLRTEQTGCVNSARALGMATAGAASGAPWVDLQKKFDLLKKCREKGGFISADKV